ncbi:MAG TPA: SRPBCC family protein [Chitinophagaceae bacterium]
MNTFLIVLLSFAAIIALILVLALVMKRTHFVRRDIVINAPRQKVFDYLRFLKNQDAFNKHAMVDPDRIREFKGIDGTVGYVYAWKGDKDAGEGEKEIINLIDGQRVETEIRFVKPMKATATIVMETESLSDNQTKVSWSNAGALIYPINFMIPILERSVAKGMDTSLQTLKGILEE